MPCLMKSICTRAIIGVVRVNLATHSNTVAPALANLTGAFRGTYESACRLSIRAIAFSVAICSLTI